MLASDWSRLARGHRRRLRSRHRSDKDLTLTLNVSRRTSRWRSSKATSGRESARPGRRRHYQKVPGALVQDRQDAGRHRRRERPLRLPTPCRSRFGGKEHQGLQPGVQAHGASTRADARSDSNSVLRSSSPPSAMLSATARSACSCSTPPDCRSAASRVFEPGFPPSVRPCQAIERRHSTSQARRGRQHDTVWAMATGTGTYGDQYTTATSTSSSTARPRSPSRLPGQGKVRTRLSHRHHVIGDVNSPTRSGMRASRDWQRRRSPHRRRIRTALAGFAIFDKVPALENYTVSSRIRSSATRPERQARLRRRRQSIDLQLKKLSTVRGVVYAIDGITPMPARRCR